MKHAELQAEAKRLGLKAGGTSEVLQARISEFKSQPTPDEKTVEDIEASIVEVREERIAKARARHFAMAVNSAPSIAEKTIDWGHRGRKGSYKLGELLDYLKAYNKRTGTRIQVNPEEGTIHGFNRNSQSQTCMTIFQPLAITQRELSRWAGLRFLPSATNPDEALELAEKRIRPYDISEYVDIIQDTAEGLEQDGKNYTIG